MINFVLELIIKAVSKEGEETIFTNFDILSAENRTSEDESVS
jgi:hypothetical protein